VLFVTDTVRKYVLELAYDRLLQRIADSNHERYNYTVEIIFLETQTEWKRQECAESLDCTNSLSLSMHIIRQLGKQRRGRRNKLDRRRLLRQSVAVVMLCGLAISEAMLIRFRFSSRQNGPVAVVWCDAVVTGVDTYRATLLRRMDSKWC